MSDAPEGHSSEMSDYIEDLQKQIAELEKQNRILSLELRSSVTLKAGEAGDRMRNRIAELEAELAAFHGIVNESQGVVGWHLSGNVATWEEFDLAPPQAGDRDEV